MIDELFAQVEQEILAWPGVNMESFAGGRGQGGFMVPPASLYRFGRKEIGHLHHTGHADLPFPLKVYDDLIAAGRAEPHGAGFAGVVTYTLRTPEDVPRVIDLFRLNYERARMTAAQRSRGENE